MAADGPIQYLVGTPGDDTFYAPIGNSHIDGGGGIDTFYSGSGVSPSHPPEVSISGTEVTVYAAVSTTVLTGFEVYVFPDRTGNNTIVNNNDGDRLVDDLFYIFHEHRAGVDPDVDYHTTGWHQGLDPNAFFDTSTYLSLYPDVRAAGVDPLVHFDQLGWKEGRAPSIAFDGAAYLAANPDVAAAHVDPLLHFLVDGIGEGRQAIPYDHLFGARDPDFDYVYYLQHNPDVGRVDPYQHYETFGWHEGRNPNAWFDSAGYLAHYPDVAAAGINPLAHYEQVGWKEGRDPSAGFDTKAYLAAYPDVAAAHVDPLMHFLHFGLAEGRSPHGDGVWA